MQRTSSGTFFEVSVDPLMLPAKRPQYLEHRFESRSRQGSNDELVDCRRQALLQERKVKLSKRQASIKKRVLAVKEKQQKALLEKKSQLKQVMTGAEKKRLEFLTMREKACAGHIVHVKRVAEAHYRRMAEQAARIQQDLDEKHAIVAIRRQKLLSIPRSRLLDADLCSAEDLKDIVKARIEAGTALQQWWRRFKFSPLIGEFMKLRLTSNSVKAMQFDVLMRKMQSKKTMNITSSLLKQIQKARSHKKSAWKAPTRVFLTIFMLISHPTEIMPKFSTAEENLQKLAIVALEAMEAWMSGYTSSEAYNLLKVTLEGLDAYFDTFDAWKKQDTTALIDGLVSHWINLERLWLSVRNHPDVETEWKPKIETQQKQVFQKLSKLGREAMSSLEKAQQELAQEVQELHDEPEEMNLDSSEILSTSPQRFPNFSERQAKKKDSVSDALSFKKIQFPVKSSVSVKSNVTGKTSVDMSRSSSVDSFAVASIDDSGSHLQGEAVDLSQVVGQVGKEAMTNEMLAHEIILNPDFKLTPREQDEMEGKQAEMQEQIAKIAKKALFDAARDDFSQGNFHKFAMIFLAEIRENFMSMVNETGKISVEIQERLDMSLIEQQLQHGSFDLRNCLMWTVSKMLQLCAPVRDASIREISAIDDYASQFERILDTQGNMKMDLANFRIQSLKPMLKKQAVEYETKKFKEALESEAITLDNTRKWLSVVSKSLEKVASVRNPENIQHPDNRVKFQEIFNEAFLNLVFSNESASASNCPETFSMDLKRIFDFQNEIQMLTIVSALIMLMRNSVPQVRRDDQLAKKLKETLVILLKDKEITLDHLQAELVSWAQKHNHSATASETERITEIIKCMVEKTLSTKDPVYSLLHRRIQSTVKTHLTTGSFKKESLGSAGLGHVATELESLSLKICLLGTHNRKVHGQWYDEILKTL